jgi:hypothetical protein
MKSSKDASTVKEEEKKDPLMIFVRNKFSINGNDLATSYFSEYQQVNQSLSEVPVQAIELVPVNSMYGNQKRVTEEYFSMPLQFTLCPELVNLRQLSLCRSQIDNVSSMYTDRQPEVEYKN